MNASATRSRRARRRACRGREGVPRPRREDVAQGDVGRGRAARARRARQALPRRVHHGGRLHLVQRPGRVAERRHGQPHGRRGRGRGAHRGPRRGHALRRARARGERPGPRAATCCTEAATESGSAGDVGVRGRAARDAGVRRAARRVRGERRERLPRDGARAAERAGLRARAGAAHRRRRGLHARVARGLDELRRRRRRRRRQVQGRVGHVGGLRLGELRLRRGQGEQLADATYLRRQGPPVQRDGPQHGHEVLRARDRAHERGLRQRGGREGGGADAERRPAVRARAADALDALGRVLGGRGRLAALAHVGAAARRRARRRPRRPGRRRRRRVPRRVVEEAVGATRRRSRS